MNKKILAQMQKNIEALGFETEGDWANDPIEDDDFERWEL